MTHRFILSFLTLTLFLLVFASAAYADKVLFLAPTRVLLNDQDKVEVVEVTNLSNITRAYKISIENLIMTPEGVTAPVETFDYAAKRLLRFVPREFVLKPGEKQSIRVMSRLPQDLPDGDYHSHMQFLENVSMRSELNKEFVDGARMEAPLSYSTLIPVVISHGKVNTVVRLAGGAAVANDKGGVDVVLDIAREGNGQGTAFIDLEYAGMPSDKLKAIPRSTVQIYRELDQRKKVITLPNIPQGVTALKVKLYDNPNKDAQAIQEITINLP